MNCVGCHSHGGGGMGPALMDGQWRYGGRIDQIATTIAEGRPNGMPAGATSSPASRSGSSRPMSGRCRARSPRTRSAPGRRAEQYPAANADRAQAGRAGGFGAAMSRRGFVRGSRTRSLRLFGNPDQPRRHWRGRGQLRSPIHGLHDRLHHHVRPGRRSPGRPLSAAGVPAADRRRQGAPRNLPVAAPGAIILRWQLHRRLRDDRPGIHLRHDEMHGAPCASRRPRARARGCRGP